MPYCPPPPLSHRQETCHYWCINSATMLQALCDTSAAALPPSRQDHRWTHVSAAGNCSSIASPDSGTFSSSTPILHPEAQSTSLHREDCTWTPIRGPRISMFSRRQYQSATQTAAQSMLWMQSGGVERSGSIGQMQQQRGFATKHQAPSQAVRESMGHQMLRSFVDSPGMLAEPYTCAPSDPKP